jgi:Nucleotidyl transferase AbiEii toxin, Type IV TA system
MNGSPQYASPAAFRRALTDRLHALAKTSRWEMQQLQRQFAYDRLLERLYRVDDGWIVKGAAALIARELGVRASVDIDVYRAKAIREAEADLRQAAVVDVGDWFRFEIEASQPVADGSSGARVPVVALIGATEWARFHVDIVGTEIVMTGAPDDVPPLAQVKMPGLEQRGYRAYPLIDHVADKIAAILQRYGPRREHPSTRFHDLVDLVSLVPVITVAAEAQANALKSEAKRRDLNLPKRFDVPDRTLWARGYEAEAQKSLLTEGTRLDDALTIVAPFIDPLLDGTATGNWDPKSRSWR